MIIITKKFDEQLLSNAKSRDYFKWTQLGGIFMFGIIYFWKTMGDFSIGVDRRSFLGSDLFNKRKNFEFFRMYLVFKKKNTRK